ncbi:hypothetical protein ACFS5L_43105 [Streptomyces phyllanthi]|uniref:TniQ family protein n=1 Tax=Streptomyces phyllanthi TaxID=1803180 RepID=A0A5N8W295_9ACTN|nr:hypothetical protein [Streptomyces phyllanthi]MPY40448.1 hypothetical protein [Streptomyces phyllanthi]
MEFHPALIRPLPITLPPFPGECESSYWNRLALANHVPLARLRSPSRWLNSRLTSLDALCILSGQSRQNLARAIPDLHAEDGSPTTKAHAPAPDYMLRWACRRCVPARTGSKLPAQVWASVHDNVCLRHNLWIGKNVFAPEQQLDLSRTPDVIRAQRHCWRLRRRYGPTVIGACYDATGKLWNGLAHRHYQLTRRAELLHDLLRVKAPTVEPDKTAPWLIAAGYPEPITLISLFASGHWRRAILSDDLLVVTQAIAEFHHRFPMQAALRGTSRTWLSTSIEATARQVEDLVPPAISAG